MSLLFGLTVNVHGIALLVDSTYPNWLGGLAIVGDVPTMIAGVLIAYTGFSCLAMTIQYAGGFPAAGLDAHGWSLHVAGEAEFGWMKLRSNNRMKTMRIALAAYTER